MRITFVHTTCSQKMNAVTKSVHVSYRISRDALKCILNFFSRRTHCAHTSSNAIWYTWHILYQIRTDPLFFPFRWARNNLSRFNTFSEDFTLPQQGVLKSFEISFTRYVWSTNVVLLQCWIIFFFFFFFVIPGVKSPPQKTVLTLLGWRKWYFKNIYKKKELPLYSITIQ